MLTLRCYVGQWGWTANVCLTHARHGCEAEMLINWGLFPVLHRLSGFSHHSPNFIECHSMPDTEGMRVKNSHVVTYTFRKRLSTRVKEQFKSLHPNLSLHFLIMFSFLVHLLTQAKDPVGNTFRLTETTPSSHKHCPEPGRPHVTDPKTMGFLHGLRALIYQRLSQIFLNINLKALPRLWRWSLPSPCWPPWNKSFSSFTTTHFFSAFGFCWQSLWDSLSRCSCTHMPRTQEKQ